MGTNVKDAPPVLVLDWETKRCVSYTRGYGARRVSERCGGDIMIQQPVVRSVSGPPFAVLDCCGRFSAACYTLDASRTVSVDKDVGAVASTEGHIVPQLCTTQRVTDLV